jgi:hypothetical protein
MRIDLDGWSVMFPWQVDPFIRLALLPLAIGECCDRLRGPRLLVHHALNYDTKEY